MLPLMHSNIRPAIALVLCCALWPGSAAAQVPSVSTAAAAIVDSGSSSPALAIAQSNAAPGGSGADLIAASATGEPATPDIVTEPAGELQSPLAPDQAPFQEAWQVTFTQTADYVTNLALPFALTPNNPSTFRDDFQFQTGAGVRYGWEQAPLDGFNVGYNFYQSLHAEVQEVDLLAHLVQAEYHWQHSERCRAALTYNYGYWFVDGASFVSQNRGGFNFLFQRNTFWDWKLGYEYADGNYRRDAALDSDGHHVRLEFVRYLDENRANHFTAGYLYNQSSARVDAYSYHGHGGFCNLHWLIGGSPADQLDLMASYSAYDFEDFDLVEPALARRDRIGSLTARLTRKISADANLFAQYRYYNSDSNVARQNYQSDLVSVGLNLTW